MNAEPADKFPETPASDPAPSLEGQARTLDADFRGKTIVGTSPADKLLIDIAELAHLTSLSIRTLRRMDSARDIPGRVAAGRRVLFQTEFIREWVRAGLPDHHQWAALQKRKTKR